MRKLGFAVVGLVAFILGFIAGSFVVARVAGRGMELLTQGQPADLVTHVYKAAKLRLGDTRPVLDHEELLIDGSILSVGALPASERAPGSAADKALRSAKLYRSVYPASGDGAAEVNKVLDSVSADGPANNETMLRGLAAGKSGG